VGEWNEDKRWIIYLAFLILPCWSLKRQKEILKRGKFKILPTLKARERKQEGGRKWGQS